MANLYVQTSEIQQTPTGRWNVIINGRNVEGGFFSRAAADASLAWWKVNYRDDRTDAQLLADTLKAAREFDSRYAGWSDEAIAADLVASGRLTPELRAAGRLPAEFFDDALGQGRR